jgi:hypothetical protein
MFANSPNSESEVPEKRKKNISDVSQIIDSDLDLSDQEDVPK